MTPAQIRERYEGPDTSMRRRELLLILADLAEVAQSLMNEVGDLAVEGILERLANIEP